MGAASRKLRYASFLHPLEAISHSGAGGRGCLLLILDALEALVRRVFPRIDTGVNIRMLRSRDAGAHTGETGCMCTVCTAARRLRALELRTRSAGGREVLSLEVVSW